MNTHAKESEGLAPSSRFIRKMWWAGWISVVAFVVVGGGYWFWFHHVNDQRVSADSAVWGSFGDFLAGVLGPLFSLLAFLALLYSLVLQRDDLEQTRIEVKKSREEAAKSNQLRELELKMGALGAAPRLDGAFAVEGPPEFENDRVVLDLGGFPLYEAKLLGLEGGDVSCVGTTYVVALSGALVVNPTFSEDSENADYWLAGLTRTGQPVYFAATIENEPDVGDPYLCFRSRPRLESEVPAELGLYRLNCDRTSDFGNAVSGLM